MFDDVTCKSCGRGMTEHRGRPLQCPDDEREAMGPHEARSAYAGPTKLDSKGRTEDGERYRRSHGLPPQTDDGAAVTFENMPAAEVTGITYREGPEPVDPAEDDGGAAARGAILGRPFPAGPDYIYAMQESGYAPSVEECRSGDGDGRCIDPRCPRHGVREFGGGR